MRGVFYSQEKVETPAGGITSNIRSDSAIQSPPPLGLLDVLQRPPYLFSYPALWWFVGDLKLDLQEVERVHAQDGYDPCADTCECMVLHVEH